MIKFPRMPNDDGLYGVTGRTWNALIDTIERMDRFYVAQPLSLADNAQGRFLSILPSADNAVRFIRNGTSYAGIDLVGGAYYGSILPRPTATADLSTTALSQSDVGDSSGDSTDGLQDCIIINPREWGGTGTNSAHALVCDPSGTNGAAFGIGVLTGSTTQIGTNTSDLPVVQLDEDTGGSSILWGTQVGDWDNSGFIALQPVKNMAGEAFLVPPATVTASIYPNQVAPGAYSGISGDVLCYTSGGVTTSGASLWMLVNPPHFLQDASENYVLQRNATGIIITDVVKAV